MKKICIAAIGFLFVSLVACRTVSGPATTALSDKTALSRDAGVTGGTFENGMSWLVLKNTEPANRLYLRLAVKAGAILEEDDQKGVAHFIEHMAFNGTEHFAKNELIDYFETIGMTFGPEVNAYTGFDETVYMLEIPADDPAVLAKSLLVLRDWASALTFDAEELEKERGVVLEEWRLGRGADGRVQDRQIPFLFNGSRYGSRLPIGDPEILKTIPRARVLDFYRKWYRPELMTVMLVGDAEPSVMAKAIEEALSGIPASKTASRVPEYPIAAQKGPAVLIVRDPEISYTTIQMMEQSEARGIFTVADLRRQLAQNMAYSIFNDRLSEKMLGSNPLMLAAHAGNQRISKPGLFTYLGMVPSNGNFIPAFEQLLEELLRIEKFGVTEAELAREKQSVLDGITQTWLERDKFHSGGRIGALSQYVLRDEMILSIQNRYDLYNSIVPGITAKEVSLIIASWYTGRGKLLFVSASEAANDIPDEKALLSLWQDWKPATSITAYSENNLDRPLYEAPGTPPGSIIKEEIVSRSGIKKWTLSNGACVLVFPTAFKSNEVLFSAYSKGGSSLVSDAEYPSVSIASELRGMSGLNGFSAVDLQKKLAGRTVSGGAWIDDFYEGLSGSSSVADMETLFQLINLNFTKPYFSEDAYQALIAQFTTEVMSRKNEPEEVFSDLKMRLLYGPNIRKENLNEAFIGALKRETAEALYRERFADAGDFTFVFVGTLDESRLKTFVETYLAVLPGTGSKEEAIPSGIVFPPGKTEESLNMGLDQKSGAFLAFGGKTTIGPYEYELFEAMRSLLEIRLREIIREDMSGSYGVDVGGRLWGYPVPYYELNIEFGCEPGREDALSAAVMEQIRWMQNEAIPETYIAKIHANIRRSQEEGLKNNRYWMGRIVAYSMRGRPLDDITETESLLKTLSSAKMQEFARKYLHTDNYVRAYLMPKK
jgi:zinc protease